MNITPVQDLKLTPDFNHTCAACGNGPNVLLRKDDVIVSNTQMCGACYFGCADMADPDEWS